MMGGFSPPIGPSLAKLQPCRRHLYALGALALLVGALLAIGCNLSEGANSEALPQSRPAMGIEMPDEEQVSLPFTVSGWALDRAALEGTGIDVVQIVDGGCEGAVIGIAEYGIERTDIAREDGQQFLYSGWQFEVKRLRLGEHTLGVRAKSSVSDDFNQCEAIQITVE